MATASADGIPNLGHLSQVVFVDDDHVAISNQFFTKTIRNLIENPLATLLLTDPSDLRSYRFLLRHEREETTGAVFEAMDRSIDAIAALSGMSQIFALKSVEIFRVLEVELVPTPAASERQ